MPNTELRLNKPPSAESIYWELYHAKSTRDSVGSPQIHCALKIMELWLRRQRRKEETLSSRSVEGSEKMRQDRDLAEKA